MCSRPISTRIFNTSVDSGHCSLNSFHSIIYILILHFCFILVRYGSPITNIVSSTSTSSSHSSTSVSSAQSSHIFQTRFSHVLSSSTSINGIYQSDFQTQALSTFTFVSSLRGFPYKSASSLVLITTPPVASMITRSSYPKSRIKTAILTSSDVEFSTISTHIPYRSSASGKSALTQAPSSHTVFSYRRSTLPSLTSIISVNAFSSARLSYRLPTSSISLPLTSTTSFRLISYKTLSSISSPVFAKESFPATYSHSLTSINSLSDTLSRGHGSTSTNVASLTTIPEISSFQTTAATKSPVVIAISSSSDLLSVGSKTGLSNVSTSRIASISPLSITISLSPDLLSGYYLTTSSTRTRLSHFQSPHIPSNSESTVTTIRSLLSDVPTTYHDNSSSSSSPSPHATSIFQSLVTTRMPSALDILTTYLGYTSRSSVTTNFDLPDVPSSHTTAISLSPVPMDTSSDVLTYTGSSSWLSLITITDILDAPSFYSTSVSLYPVTTTMYLTSDSLTYLGSNSLSNAVTSSDLPDKTVRSQSFVIFSSKQLFSPYATSSLSTDSITFSFSSSSYVTVTLKSTVDRASSISYPTHTTSSVTISYSTNNNSSHYASIPPVSYASSSYNIVFSPLSHVTASITPSLGKLSPTPNLLSTSYKTFSLSFLSSSLVSSQPSISPDLSTGSSYTKLSTQPSRFPQPSYPSRQSPRQSRSSSNIPGNIICSFNS